jgi:signal transduction histidine kinase
MGRTGSARSGDPFPLARREIELIAAFWALYALLTVASRVVNPSGGDEPRLAAMALVAAVESILWALLTPVVFRLASQWEVTGRSRGGQIALAVAIGIASALLLTAVGTVLREALFATPGTRDAHAHGGPPLWFAFLNGLVIYGGVLAAGHARAYSLRYQERRVLATELQGELARVRLEALRRQLDPHFLFNTLNAVSTLVERDPRGVRRMIARLSELLRHSLEGADVPEIPLREELALLACYLDIMQVRFQTRLTVLRTIDERTLDALVPSLMLQPLVENAIRHGIERTSGPGCIEITSRLEDDSVLLRVRDNGPGLASAPSTPSATGGVGVRNTIARLAQLYGPGERFTLRSSDGGGAIAEVRVPYRPAAAVPVG